MLALLGACGSSSDDGGTTSTGQPSAGAAGTSTAGGAGGTSSAGSTGSPGGSGGTSSPGGAGGTGGTDAAGAGGSDAGMGGSAGKGEAGTGGGGKAGSGNAGAAGTGAAGSTGCAEPDSFECAADIEIDDTTDGSKAVQSALDPVDTQNHYYKFTGTKGQALLILANGKPTEDPFGKQYPDLVATLFDADQNQIAENDDPSPRSSNNPEIFTVLPADGTYYLRIVECNGWEKGGAMNCAPAADIVQGDYIVDILPINTGTPGNVADTEPNDAADQATALTYSLNAMTGNYYLTTLIGGFSSAKDVDVYSFTMPNDAPAPSTGRRTGSFSSLVGGPSGNGSTTSLGELSIVDPATSTTIGKVDFSLGMTAADLNVPLSTGVPYLLYVNHPDTPAGANDFYYIFHGIGGSNPLETEKAGENDMFAGAEALMAQANDDGSTSYFIEGDLLPAGTDVDHFKFAFPADMADTISIACGAERSGSGLRGLKATLLDDKGAPIAMGSAVETAEADLLISKLAINAVAGSLAVKIEAASQAPDVTSAFYRCGIHFAAAAPLAAGVHGPRASRRGPAWLTRARGPARPRKGARPRGRCCSRSGGFAVTLGNNARRAAPLARQAVRPSHPDRLVFQPGVGRSRGGRAGGRGAPAAPAAAHYRDRLGAGAHDARGARARRHLPQPGRRRLAAERERAGPRQAAAADLGAARRRAASCVRVPLCDRRAGLRAALGAGVAAGDAGDGRAAAREPAVRPAQARGADGRERAPRRRPADDGARRGRGGALAAAMAAGAGAHLAGPQRLQHGRADGGARRRAR
jgi:hypothetical protein